MPHHLCKLITGVQLAYNGAKQKGRNEKRMENKLINVNSVLFCMITIENVLV